MFRMKKSKPSCGEDHHYVKICQRSNIIQYSSDGYPLRLCIYECDKCGKRGMIWVDTVATNTDHVLTWENINE